MVQDSQFNLISMLPSIKDLTLLDSLATSLLERLSKPNTLNFASGLDGSVDALHGMARRAG